MADWTETAVYRQNSSVTLCVFTAAQEYGIKTINFTMPKVEKKQHDVLNITERKRLEQYLLHNLTNTNLGILLCLFTGLCVGELCGLTWGDIDFEFGTLSVKKPCRESISKAAPK